jgi:hypothetical protein
MEQESDGTNLVIFVVGGVVLLLLLVGGGAAFFFMGTEMVVDAEPAAGPAFDPAFVEEQQKAAQQLVPGPPVVEQGDEAQTKEPLPPK